MKTSTIIMFASVFCVLILGIAAASTYIGTYNTEVKKYKLYEAKQKNIENIYDDVWKTISQTAQISEDYRTSFDSIYTNIMSARYDKGDGTLMKWIKENNPQFDTSLYMKLANTVESKREEFKNAQTDLLDVVRDYNSYISVFPNNLILSGKQEIKPKLILSTKTNQAIETGVDDDVKLFTK